ncbi:hypothetical protein [Microvirga alba]|uniref:Uncharacterized protein n=1 Tax=Microvirga alba TaxID=2791025 RepID=A0A931BSK0_9HYPH|nr:hypothetical protein [Microvirga alba]MBF9234450.1 hypothetical protein [Microvirga alba]
MRFHFIPKPVRAENAAAGFTLDRVWTRDDGHNRDISNLLDQTYMYQSARELQWHLADRFGICAQTVELTFDA